MAYVTIRELRNQGGDVIDRVQKGERIIVTRSGRPVAELQPLRHKGPDPETLLDRWRHLPKVDPDKMRQDIDEIIDPTL
ncbi:type II toxin-antitoxin system Phd/YefM family antitoxin [Candidatus Poriferisocius sp.]|uniref:type II toxin-antitoxin system Phd/YefM family antitoxin n=1 Tax=Candidatus Poriferisocius sp. TaxID=3101276 RepID=UPI003B029458